MINRIDPVPNELAVRKLGTDSVQIGLADSVKAILNRPEVVLPEPTDLSSVLARIAALEGAIQQVPPGLIAMWSGLLANIPLGWALCLTGDTKVLLSDGNQVEIQEIVRNKTQATVMSFNESTGRIEPKKVIDWFENDACKQDWIRLKIYRGNGFGSRSVTCTSDHPVWVVGKGWTPAKNIQNRDVVLKFCTGLSTVGRHAIAGMLMGDGSISQSGRFSLVHGAPQSVYLNHTASKLGTKAVWSESKSGYSAGLQYGTIKISLRSIDPEFVNEVKHPKSVEKILPMLGPIGLAYWYMDDGNLQSDDRSASVTERAQFHTEGFNFNDLHQIQKWFLGMLGIQSTAYSRNNTGGWLLRLDEEGSEKLFTAIAPYVHPSMRYKLPKRFRNVPYLLEEASFLENKPVPHYVTAKRIVDLNPSKRNLKIFKKRFDIKVEDNHSFIANGFVVHNCDGTNGTPDLRDKFIKGSAAGIDPGVTGGSSTHTHDDHSYTPAGTVSAPTFTGTPAATSSDSGGTPAGTVSQPTFTGDALGTHSHGVGTYANTAISAGTPDGTIAWPAGVPTAANESAHTHSVTSNVSVNDHAAHTHSVTSNVSVDTHASHTHTFTASATAATPDLVTSNTAAAGVAPSGTTAGPSAALTHVTNNPAVTSGNPSATLSHTTNNPAVTSGAGSAHTHVMSWPAGVPTFAGAALGTHNHVFSGSSEAISGGTPSGTVSQPTFTGSALAAHSHNYTPAGTNSTPTFTGTPALLSHSVASNEPVFYSLAFIMKL